MEAVAVALAVVADAAVVVEAVAAVSERPAVVALVPVVHVEPLVDRTSQMWVERVMAEPADVIAHWMAVVVAAVVAVHKEAAPASLVVAKTAELARVVEGVGAGLKDLRQHSTASADAHSNVASRSTAVVAVVLSAAAARCAALGCLLNGAVPPTAAVFHAVFHAVFRAAVRVGAVV